MENEDWVTGNVRINLGGQPLDLQMTVPAKPVKARQMLPIFQQVATSFVGMSETAVENGIRPSGNMKSRSPKSMA